MSPSLPPEIFDLVIDHLRGETATLRVCCLVSKSWVPRTRKHLFAHIKFYAQKSHIERWKEIFPDPSNSPAYHARNLSIRGVPTIVTADADAGGWIHTFHCAANFNLDTLGRDDSRVALSLLRGLSPTLKSLTLTYTSIPPSEVFNFVCSFPLLEDLALLSRGHEGTVGGWRAPLASPKFTGSLYLGMKCGIRSTVHRLLDLPGGLHFSKITVLCLKEDVESTTDLLSRCSGTLEYLRIYYLPNVDSSSLTTSFNLSTATKLKELTFHVGRLNVRWVTATLQTVSSANLQWITIHSHATSPSQIKEAVRQAWHDLDHMLVQFCTSRTIRPKIACKMRGKGSDLKDLAPNLLPELTRRGALILTKCNRQSGV